MQRCAVDSPAVTVGRPTIGSSSRRCTADICTICTALNQFYCTLCGCECVSVSERPNVCTGGCRRRPSVQSMAKCARHRSGHTFMRACATSYTHGARRTHRIYRRRHAGTISVQLLVGNMVSADAGANAGSGARAHCSRTCVHNRTGRDEMCAGNRKIAAPEMRFDRRTLAVFGR